MKTLKPFRSSVGKYLRKESMKAIGSLYRVPVDRPTIRITRIKRTSRQKAGDAG